MAGKYFLYARKSTESEERQALSIEAQITELRQFAGRERLHIVEEFTESKTAKVPGRSIFNSLIDRMEKGEADGILAWHPDRLARNSVDGGRVIFLLDTGHIQSLKFPTFWFENTPQGKFMLQIAFGQSKYYVDNLSENIRRGIRQKIRRGDWPGVAPTGYLNDPVSRKIVVDPLRGPLVVKIFEEFVKGSYSIAELKRRAPEWGLLTRKDKPFCHAGLRRLLTNPIYYGLFEYDGETHQGRHQPLISQDLFDRVQAILKRNGLPHKKRKHLFPYLGLATCGTCGGAITAERQKNRYHYYRCTKKKGPCKEPFVREELLGEQIRDAIEKVALPDVAFQKFHHWLDKDGQASTQTLAKAKSHSGAEVTALQLKLDRLLDAHLDGIVDQSEYQAKKASLLRRKVKLEEKLKQLRGEASVWLEPCRDFLLAAQQAPKDALAGDGASQKEFLKTIGSNFRVSAKSLSFSYDFPWVFLAKSQTIIKWWSGGGSNLFQVKDRNSHEF